MTNAIAIILHLLAINIWIGGTFFTVMVLPRAMASLETSQQLRLMQEALRRFFLWVWLAVLILAGSGGWMIARVFGGLANAPRHVIVMVVLALGMMAAFALIFFGPYQRFQQAQQRQDPQGSQLCLAQICLLSKINVGLGIGVVVVIGAGPYFLT